LIGIDPEKFAQLAAKAATIRRVAAAARLDGERLAIGVDRLDY
jgi:trehalose-6-phosphate synthase